MNSSDPQLPVLPTAESSGRPLAKDSLDQNFLLERLIKRLATVDFSGPDAPDDDKDGLDPTYEQQRPPKAKDNIFLDSIQGNILNPHGRAFSRLLLFQFDDKKAKAARQDFFPKAVQAQLVTSGYQQWLDARSGDKTKEFYSLGISLSGLQACGYVFTGDWPLGGSGGFGVRMLDNFGNLGDAEGVPGKPAWEDKYLEELEPHGVWLLAHDCTLKADGTPDLSALSQMQENVRIFLKSQDAHITGQEDGKRWKDRDDTEEKLVREPFGFLDGLSQPEFFKGDAREKRSKWIRIPRAQVLIRHSKGESADHDDGSFLVLRKLEQNVAGFRCWERGATLNQDLGRVGAGQIEPGALLLGRERNGKPLAPQTAGANLNDFDFEKTARCPFHAHIRKANPRMASEAGRMQALFVRRSAVYDENGLLPQKASADYAEGETIGFDSKVGLLFMGYMGTISQFMVLQSEWFSDPEFPVAKTGMGDPIVRGPILDNTTSPPWDRTKWPKNWPNMPGGKPSPITGGVLPKFVRPRGGAYFYVPSMKWLNSQKAGTFGEFKLFFKKLFGGAPR